MTARSFFWFIALAPAYAAVVTIVLGGMCLALGLRSTRRTLPTLFVTLVFVFLTQHPFPVTSELDRPVQYAEPNWVPFYYVRYLPEVWRKSRDAGTFLVQGSALAVPMKLLICAVIGGLLSRHLVSLQVAALVGFSLSLAIELTQLTGTWGLYPSAYRKFDVDDLLLNTLGVALGLAVARR